MYLCLRRESCQLEQKGKEKNGNKSDQWPHCCFFATLLVIICSQRDLSWSGSMDLLIMENMWKQKNDK